MSRLKQWAGKRWELCASEYCRTQLRREETLESLWFLHARLGGAGLGSHWWVNSRNLE